MSFERRDVAKAARSARFASLARRVSPGVLIFAVAAPLAAPTRTTPAYLSEHRTNGGDREAIEKLLSTYTTSVSTGDRPAFESLLLDDQVPFSSAEGPPQRRPGGATVETRLYSQFRASIFESGVHYSQRFYNVRIEQDGVLAHVSLDFVTKETATGQGGFGWKTLQLLKVDGAWKIASEFYTGRPLPDPS